ncbi:MAG: hypothetical protein MI749_14610 [Desulfovibrionales bacterium]|nr:hypothetical protein [Desulfovibrionales bacterium]
MFDTSFFPDWLAPDLIDDETFGIAYDAVPDNKRAWLKTTIARLHVLYGTPQVTWGRQENHWRQGHVSITETRPVDFALVLVDSRYASGVRLLAAAMMPLLGGVEDILVAFTGDAPVAPECLAALELAGIEAAVQCSVEKGTELLTVCNNSSVTGRVITLGTGARTLARQSCASSNFVQVWDEPSFSAIGVHKNGAFDTALLAWAHPDWDVVEVTEDDFAEDRSFAAVCCESDIVDAVPDYIPVSLGAGQEGCWIWPDLTPQWFMHRRFSLLSEV